MKIAIVSFFTPPFSCGNSMLAQRLADGLCLRGHEVRVFNCQNDAPQEAVDFAPQVVHALHAERCFSWLGVFKSHYRAFLVISLTGTDYTTWAGTERPPAVIAQSLKQADALVVFHEQPAQAIGVALPEVSHKLMIIPQGVTPLAYRPDRLAVRARYGLTNRHILFLMAAGIRPVKNIPLGMEAFSRIERSAPGARMLLAGPVLDATEAELIASLAKRVPNFTSLGDLPSLVARELMSASEVFLNTSLHEGMSGAILEAMAEGVPVVASDIPGNRALVVHGVTGLLFPSNDVKALAHALATLAADATLRHQLGEAGFQRVGECFSVKIELDRYEELYRRVIHAPRS